MVKIKIKVPWECGLHLRPVSHLVEIIRYSNCDVMIGSKNKMVKGTRIIEIVELGIQKEEYVYFEIKGKDEELVKKKIKDFFTCLR